MSDFVFWKEMKSFSFDFVHLSPASFSHFNAGLMGDFVKMGAKKADRKIYLLLVKNEKRRVKRKGRLLRFAKAFFVLKFKFFFSSFLFSKKKGSYLASYQVKPSLASATRGTERAAAFSISSERIRAAFSFSSTGHSKISSSCTWRMREA